MLFTQTIGIRRWITLTLALFLTPSFASARGTCDDPIDVLQKQFDATIKPILTEKCGQCHSGDEANAGISINAFTMIEQVLNADRKWSLIDHEIESGSMPPEEEPALTDREASQVRQWIADVFRLIDCETINPGNVTIRKLTRYEYRNTIADLFGVDYRPAEDFPGDDVGHGFDNVADVLSLPPILLERYLEAAEEISRRSIFDPDESPLDISLAGSSFVMDPERIRDDNGAAFFFAEGRIFQSIRFPEVGAYALAIRAYGDQAGNENVRMSVHVDGRLLDTVEVKSTRRKPSMHVLRVPVYEVGEKKIAISFDNDYYRPRSVGRQDRNLAVLGVYAKGPKHSEPVQDYLRFENEDRETAVAFIKKILPRAFRNRVDDGEVDRFVGLFDQSRNSGQSFYGSLRMVTQAILISPQFLYRFEQPVGENQIRLLNDYERATALSYFIWSSTPDDQLLSLAAKNRLSDGATWQTEIQRLVSDPKSEALIDNFFAQWLNLRVLSSIAPDPNLFPGVNAELLKDMATETQMVVADIVRRDGSVLELLDCNFSYINNRLAAHYGLPAVEFQDDAAHDAFRRISLGKNRSGVLTHASIMTLTSNPTRTSPVKRGKWVMENILGEDPPPPLADVMPLDDQKELKGSLRERMQQHRTNPA
jgi:hypothetical protein